MFFAGLTGDVFAQFYPIDGRYRGDGISGISILHGDEEWIHGLFRTCGYTASFASLKQLSEDREAYRQALIQSIDRSVPVIRWVSDWLCDGVLVGHEDYGKTLLFITGDDAQPKRLSFDEAIAPHGVDAVDGWLFIGDKVGQPNIADLYRDAIRNLPNLLESKVFEYVLGARAFRAWADDIEGGRYDGIKPEEFDPWGMYTAYVCALATNASCCHGFLDKAMAECPDLSFLEEVKAQYARMAAMWNHDDGTDLEALGGGFNVTLEALQDRDKRTRISNKLRAFASCVDEVVQIFRENRQ
jgi:hypothetical protein